MTDMVEIQTRIREQVIEMERVKQQVMSIVTEHGTRDPTPSIKAAANRFFEHLDDAAMWIQALPGFMAMSNADAVSAAAAGATLRVVDGGEPVAKG